MEPRKGSTLCLLSLFSAWMEPLWAPFGAGGVGSALLPAAPLPPLVFQRAGFEFLEELSCANPSASPSGASAPQPLAWHSSSALDDPGGDGTSETWPEGTQRVGAEHSRVAELPPPPHLLGRSGPGCSRDRDSEVVADGRTAMWNHPAMGRARGLARRRRKSSRPCCPRQMVEVRESPTLLSSLPLSQGFARYG